ncbi:MAG: ATP-binding protein [Solirubrobacteraceae bacterium]
MAVRTGPSGPFVEEVNVTPDMELKLPAHADNVAVVRHAVAGLADVVSIDELTLADIKLAITEACTNVIIHAYDAGEQGTLEVEASIADDVLAVLIRDRGIGIAPRTGSPGLGLGLPLIATLADSLELGSDDAECTEVRMTFRLDQSREAA